MKHSTVELGHAGFAVTFGNEHSQSATMVLEPGESEGGPDNRHRGADQWLYVVEGQGSATVSGNKVALAAGSLLLIEAGDPHEIRNTGRGLLKTLNVYVPPAYDDDGEELAPGNS